MWQQAIHSEIVLSPTEIPELIKDFVEVKSTISADKCLDLLQIYIWLQQNDMLLFIQFKSNMLNNEYCDNLHKWTISSFHGYLLQLQFLNKNLQGLFSGFLGMGIWAFFTISPKIPMFSPPNMAKQDWRATGAILACYWRDTGPDLVGVRTPLREICTPSEKVAPL